MSDTCRAFDNGPAALPDGVSSEGWESHFRSCAACREQETADRALRDLFARAVRPPELSPFFARRCARRARLAASCRPLGMRQRLLLRAYWLVAVAVSAVVIVRAGGPVDLTPSAVAGAAMVAASLLVPIWLLTRARGGLLAFVRRVTALD